MIANILLEVSNLTKSFQGFVANEDLNFKFKKNEIHCIIGPNGAGKTTFISLISGHLYPTKGKIIYKNRLINNLDVVTRANLGIARKFQTPSVFSNLTVLENLELAIIKNKNNKVNFNKKIEWALDLIKLENERDTLSQNLSHGQRQWLEIGLLLGMDAELLLMDEPTAGMTESETEATANLIKDLASIYKKTIIIIEHDIAFIKNLNSNIIVLHLGKLFVSGTYDQISSNKKVKDIYLGNEK
jgi:urea ABC transporter ATP-binding protein UrtD